MLELNSKYQDPLKFNDDLNKIANSDDWIYLKAQEGGGLTKIGRWDKFCSVIGGWLHLAEDRTSRECIDRALCQIVNNNEAWINTNEQCNNIEKIARRANLITTVSDAKKAESEGKIPKTKVLPQDKKQTEIAAKLEGLKNVITLRNREASVVKERTSLESKNIIHISTHSNNELVAKAGTTTEEVIIASKQSQDPQNVNVNDDNTPALTEKAVILELEEVKIPKEALQEKENPSEPPAEAANSKEIPPEKTGAEPPTENENSQLQLDGEKKIGIVSLKNNQDSNGLVTQERGMWDIMVDTAKIAGSLFVATGVAVFLGGKLFQNDVSQNDIPDGSNSAMDPLPDLNVKNGLDRGFDTGSYQNFWEQHNAEPLLPTFQNTYSSLTTKPEIKGLENIELHLYSQDHLNKVANLKNENETQALNILNGRAKSGLSQTNLSEFLEDISLFIESSFDLDKLDKIDELLAKFFKKSSKIRNEDFGLSLDDLRNHNFEQVAQELFKHGKGDRLLEEVMNCYVKDETITEGRADNLFHLLSIATKANPNLARPHLSVGKSHLLDIDVLDPHSSPVIIPLTPSQMDRLDKIKSLQSPKEEIREGDFDSNERDADILIQANDDKKESKVDQSDSDTAEDSMVPPESQKPSPNQNSENKIPQSVQDLSSEGTYESKIPEAFDEESFKTLSTSEQCKIFRKLYDTENPQFDKLSSYVKPEEVERMYRLERNIDIDNRQILGIDGKAFEKLRENVIMNELKMTSPKVTEEAFTEEVGKKLTNFFNLPNEPGNRLDKVPGFKELIIEKIKKHPLLRNLTGERISFDVHHANEGLLKRSYTLDVKIMINTNNFKSNILYVDFAEIAQELSGIENLSKSISDLLTIQREGDYFKGINFIVEGPTVVKITPRGY